MNELSTIYALCDPDTHEVRYIGKTVDIGRRMKQHSSYKIIGKSHTKSWLKSLRPKIPNVIIVEQVNFFEWKSTEIFWIAYFKMLGANLTNTSIGGDGANGTKLTTEHKLALSLGKLGSKNPMYGKHLTDEHRKKQSESLKGRVVSDETRKKLSRPRSEVSKINMSKPRPSIQGKNHVLYGTHRSEEIRQKISLSQKGIPKPSVAGDNHYLRKRKQMIEVLKCWAAI